MNSLQFLVCFGGRANARSSVSHSPEPRPTREVYRVLAELKSVELYFVACLPWAQHSRRRGGAWLPRHSAWHRAIGGPTVPPMKRQSNQRLPTDRLRRFGRLPLSKCVLSLVLRVALKNSVEFFGVFWCVSVCCGVLRCDSVRFGAIRCDSV